MAHRTRRTARKRTSPPTFATALIAAALTTTGCQSMAMTQGETSPISAADVQGAEREWPLRFMGHNFGIATYALQECTVLYADRLHTSGQRPALEDVHPNSLKVKTANHLMIRNFPAPAIVKWKSRDGTPLEAHVDIGEIFRDERVVHNTPREEASLRTPMINPDVIMEINDRTINVYMKAFISLREPRIPGNRHSNYRSELVLAWSKIY